MEIPIIRGFRDTSLRAKNETGISKALNLDINDNMNKALFKSAGMDKGDITLNSLGWEKILQENLIIYYLKD